MIVWLVTPAWGRFPVTRLALAQRAFLRGELAPQGVELRCVVIADDDNLDIATGYGFDTIEMPNILGAKINAGFQHALERDADYLCYCGSDDWMHPDLFTALDGRIVTGHKSVIVDLERSRLRRILVQGDGAPPWLIPRDTLGTVEPARMRALDYSLLRGLRDPEWVFHDPHDFCRVEFKTSVSISSYDALASLGYGPEEEPWAALTEHYPAGLVEMARNTGKWANTPSESGLIPPSVVAA